MSAAPLTAPRTADVATIRSSHTPSSCASRTWRATTSATSATFCAPISPCAVARRRQPRERRARPTSSRGRAPSSSTTSSRVVFDPMSMQAQRPRSRRERSCHDCRRGLSQDPPNLAAPRHRGHFAGADRLLSEGSILRIRSQSTPARPTAPRHPRSSVRSRLRRARDPRPRPAQVLRGVEAVRGIDFEVARGEVFGLLGPNGAGKTTTVEILEGYRARTSGIVSVLGHDPGDAPARAARARRASCCSAAASTATSPCARWSRTGPASTRAARRRGGHRRSSGCASPSDVRARTLSGGQARRLDLALALVGDPELDLPRRADDRLRPGGAARGVGHDPLARRARQDRAARRRTTSTRRRRCATAWRSSRTGGSSPIGAPGGARRRRASRYRVSWRDDARRAARRARPTTRPRSCTS